MKLISKFKAPYYLQLSNNKELILPAIERFVYWDGIDEVVALSEEGLTKINLAIRDHYKLNIKQY